MARIEGLVTFVTNAKQGEHVKIKVTRISRRFAEAEVVGERRARKTQSDEEKTDS